MKTFSAFFAVLLSVAALAASAGTYRLLKTNGNGTLTVIRQESP